MMLLDYFGVFGWISRKMDEINKSGQFRGSTPWHRGPTQLRGREEAWRGLWYAEA